VAVLLLDGCGSGMGADRVRARASPSSNSGASAVPALLSQCAVSDDRGGCRNRQPSWLAAPPAKVYDKLESRRRGQQGWPGRSRKPLWGLRSTENSNPSAPLLLLRTVFSQR
jgi:hypothetical protein